MPNNLKIYVKEKNPLNFYVDYLYVTYITLIYLTFILTSFLEKMSEFAFHHLKSHKKIRTTGIGSSILSATPFCKVFTNKKASSNVV